MGAGPQGLSHLPLLFPVISRIRSAEARTQTGNHMECQHHEPTTVPTMPQHWPIPELSEDLSCHRPQLINNSTSHHYYHQFRNMPSKIHQGLRIDHVRSLGRNVNFSSRYLGCKPILLPKHVFPTTVGC